MDGTNIGPYFPSPSPSPLWQQLPATEPNKMKKTKFSIFCILFYEENQNIINKSFIYDSYDLIDRFCSLLQSCLHPNCQILSNGGHDSFNLFLKKKTSLINHSKTKRNHILGDGLNKYWSLFPPHPHAWCGKSSLPGGRHHFFFFL